MGLFAQAVVAVDGSKFKAVSNWNRNFTANKVTKRIEPVDASIERYLAALDALIASPAMSLKPKQTGSRRSSRGSAATGEPADKPHRAGAVARWQHRPGQRPLAAAVTTEEGVGELPLVTPWTGRGYGDLDAPDAGGDDGADLEQAQPDRAARCIGELGEPQADPA